MPDAPTINLTLAAFTVALVHTAAGPDHYLPFVMLSRARAWSRSRTAAITTLCGLGHVGTSLLIGLLGAGMGIAAGSIEGIESQRATWAAWALIAFGLGYAVWGLRRHQHSHDVKLSATSWGLFVIFALGPCEPLIPLMFLAGGQGGWLLAGLVAAVFAGTTLITMLTITLLGRAGFERLHLDSAQRWLHPISGCVIAASGVAMVFGF